MPRPTLPLTRPRPTPPSRRDREGTSRLAKATDVDAVRGAIDAYHDYRCFYPPLLSLQVLLPLPVVAHPPSLVVPAGAC